MDGHFANIENLIRKTEETLLTKIENNTTSDRAAKTRKREINHLNKIFKKLTITNDIEYIDEKNSYAIVEK